MCKRNVWLKSAIMKEIVVLQSADSVNIDTITGCFHISNHLET